MTTEPEDPFPARADLSAVLGRAVGEAARFLDANGAILYLYDAATGMVEWSHDAGITDERELAWARSLRFPVGTGLFGAAIAERRLTSTPDYPADPRFVHTAELDRFVDAVGLRSLIVAPLIGADEGPLGALGAYAHRPDAFDEADAVLLTALAGHAALTIDTSRLIERLRASQAELARRADELRASEARLRESEARYRSLVDHSPDIIVELDAERRLTFISERAVELIGWRPDELVGRSSTEIIDPDSREAVEALWAERVRDPGLDQSARFRLVRRDGRSIPVEMHSIGIVVDGRFSGAQASIRDTSERDRLDRDLRRHAAELASSQERAHLAQELHDSVTQALFSMTLTARSAEMLLDRDLPAAREKLAELRELGRDALTEMRSLVFELRPGGIEDDGLALALRKHAAAVQGRTGLPIVLAVDEVPRATLDVEEAVYRIAQEAVHNVIKHARARQARIVLSSADGALRLAVEDDGRGFDAARVPGGHGHLGLDGMRARAERIGARLTVTSSPGAGTRIEVLAPARPADPTGGEAPAGGQAE